MELVREAVLHAELGVNLFPGPTPTGMSIVAPVTGGWVKGERLNGTVTGPGADWLLVGNDGYGRLDVRVQMVTDDGACIYAYYDGVLEMNEAFMAASGSDGSTDFGDNYFRTLVRMETGDERYAWVNTTVFVGCGRAHENGVEYELYRVT